MNIFNIALLEIKQNIRNVRTFVFMLAFPIVLMLILGTALSNVYTSAVPVEQIKVLWDSGNNSNNAFTEYFNEFRKQAEKSGVTFKEASNETDSINEVKQNLYNGYLSITDDGIQLFVNEREGIEASILQGMLTAFVDKYNVAAVVAKVAPDQVDAIFSNHTQGDYIKEKTINSNKIPGAMDYYAIAMTTMIALYAAMFASGLIDGERVRNTANRLMASPISKGELFTGKVFGAITINYLCIIVVVFFSKLVYHADWGNHFWLVLFILLTEVIFAVSFGLAMSFFTKTGASSRVLIMILVQLASFFGGAYFKIENTGGLMDYIRQLSPLTWANTAITKIIYNNDIMAAVPTLSLNIGLSVLFLLISIIALQRREGL